MNNKEKNTRMVTFSEDHPKTENPIYRKGSTHAIHKDMVPKLKAKGAKFNAELLNKEPIIKRRKKLLAENKNRSLAK